MKSKYSLGVTLIICLIALLFPFLIRCKTDSLNAVLTLSFTALGAVATLATFVIAFKLFDRFGLRGKFIQQQTDKVIELALALQHRYFFIHADKHVFIIHGGIKFLKHMLSFEVFQEYSMRKISIREKDYEEYLRDFAQFQDHHFMPTSINQKLKFLDIIGIDTDEIPETEKNNYVLLNLGYDADGTWCTIAPKITYQDFIINYQNLFIEINKWLQEHSDIFLNLDLEK